MPTSTSAPAAAPEPAPKPASKPVPSPRSRPPAFVDCYVCKKQFGSHSVALHEPRCLERWRAANAALPAAQRAAEPSPPADRAKPSSEVDPPEAALNSSWPRSSGRLRAALEAEQSPRVSRPKTATLKKPLVLDAEKKAELDMSTTRCNELLAIVAQNRRRRAERSASEERGGRPQTIKLTQPSSRDLNVPNIDYRPAAVISPEGRSRAAKATTKLGRRLPNFTRALEELFHAPRAKAGVPRPCMSCGKPENPERFHSHPADPPSEPPRRAKRPQKKRMSIQRPVAMKYKPPPTVPQPPNMDPVAQRKLQLEEEQRQKQARLREEYLKKEEKSRKAREDAMRKKLAFTMAKQQRVANGGGVTQTKQVVCYVCQKLFGATSLLIHQPQCLEKWRRDNEALPEDQRKPEPQPPPQDTSTAEDGGEPALKQAGAAEHLSDESQLGLVACRHCGRTFFPDRVALHEKNCRPKDSDAAAREAPSQDAPPTVCYICKGRFPTDQLAAHELECLTRWRAQNAATTEQVVPLPPAVLTPAPPPPPLPPVEGEGQVTPVTAIAETVSTEQEPSVDPAVLPGPAEQLEGQLDAMIDAAWQSHLSELVPCPNCSRTFFPDRLDKHTKNCKTNAKQK